jgi:uncharacterized protein YbjT (DUF2867 family)
LIKEAAMSSTSDKQPVLVLGGTGHYGVEIVKTLEGMGEGVRVLSRNKESAVSALGQGVQVMEGDITNRESVQRAVEGARAIVVAVSAIAPKTIRRIERIEVDSVLALFDTAAELGVSRVVYLSAYELDEDLVEDLKIEKLARIKRAVEAALKETSLDWTVLGCPPTMALYARFLRGDKLIAPGGLTKPMPTVSPSDVGHIAAQAVLRDDLGKQRFRMCSDRPMTADEAAEIIGKLLGKEVTVRRIPMGVFNVGTAILGLLNPFFRYIYMGVKVFNNFPSHLIENIPDDHRRLQETFSYPSRSLKEELAIQLGVSHRR